MGRPQTTRAKIRHYLINMLKDEVDVGGRVFSNRPTSPFMLEELPAICVFYLEEATEVIAGSQYIPKEYQRNASIVITVMVEEVLDPSTSVNENQKGEDYLDYLSEQVEKAIFRDVFLGRRLDGFNPNRPEGLTYGSRLEGSRCYDVETESDREVIASDIRWTFPYQSPGYVDTRFPAFEDFYAAIVRVGRTEETIDPVLLDAEGELSQ